MSKISVSITIREDDEQTQCIESRDGEDPVATLAAALATAIHSASYRLASYGLVFAHMLVHDADTYGCDGVHPKLRVDYDKLADQAGALIAKSNRIHPLTGRMANEGNG